MAGAVSSDWLSYYGENSIDQWMIPYFGASVYDDPAVPCEELGNQTISSVRRRRTLVVVGDRDDEGVPAAAVVRVLARVRASMFHAMVFIQ